MNIKRPKITRVHVKSVGKKLKSFGKVVFVIIVISTILLPAVSAIIAIFAQ